MPDRANLARRTIDAIERLSVEEALRVFDPAVELTTLFDRLGEPPLRGADGVRAWFERMNGTWAFIEIRDWRLEEHGDWLLVTGSARVRGRASPDVLELDWAAAGRVSDGRLATFGVYLTRGEAIEAIRRG